MTKEQCHSYPTRTVAECWHYIDEAMQIMNDTRILSYESRMAIVKDEYDRQHKAN